jgi:predicted N-acetyltransferase YhbS
MIAYQKEENLPVNEFIEVLNNSTLGERRPVDDMERVKMMVDNATLIVTARDNGKLIGVARSITDYSYCTYMSDLAVDINYQKQGIGKELIKITKKYTPLAKLILLSAPAAVNYYPHIGMKQHAYCFYIDDVNEIQ